jgi:ankyrin repeat protein
MIFKFTGLSKIFKYFASGPIWKVFFEDEKTEEIRQEDFIAFMRNYVDEPKKNDQQNLIECITRIFPDIKINILTQALNTMISKEYQSAKEISDKIDKITKKYKKSSFATAIAKIADQNAKDGLGKDGLGKDGLNNNDRELLSQFSSLEWYNIERSWHGIEPIDTPLNTKFLIKLGANVNVHDTKANYGQTPLIAAVKYASKLSGYYKNNEGGKDKIDESLETINVLFGNNAEVNAINDYGQTALICASRYQNNGSVINIIMAHNPNVNIQDKTGRTALMYAAMNGDYEVINTLIDNGANVNIIDEDGKTALDYFKEYEKYRINFLVNRNGYKNIQTKLQPAKVDARDEHGRTPLMRAAESGQIDEMKKLIENGADVNLGNKAQKTALTSAIQSGQTEAVNYLLKNNADITLKDNEGSTALMCAAENGNEEAMDKLIEKGANVDVQDKDGKTALMCAAENGNEAAMDKLIEKGANVDVQDKDGKTALMCAAENGNEAAMKKLIAKGANEDVLDKNGKTASYYLEKYKDDHPTNVVDINRSSLEKKGGVGSVKSRSSVFPSEATGVNAATLTTGQDGRGV